MGDPLSDPRALRLLSADPGEIAALAGSFHKVASQAQTAAAGLRGAQGDASWTGGAATAFRAQVGKLPGDLDKVQHSYGEVAGGLDAYGSQLGPIQTQFRALAVQLQNARSSLSSAQGQLSSAKTSLSSATAAPKAKSTAPAVINAHTALQAASGAVGNLQSQVAGLESRGFHLLDEADTIRGHAHSAVSNAAGIAPSQSWLSGALHDVGNFVSGVAKGIYHDVTDLPSAIANVVEHPTSLKDWGELVKDVAVTASLVAMIAAPFAAPELAEADAAVDAGAGLADAAGGAGDAAAGGTGDAAAGGAGDGAGDAAANGSSKLTTARNGLRHVSDGGGKVSTVAGGLSAGTDAAQGHWKDAVVDLGFMVAPNLGSMPKSLGDVKGIGDQVSNVLRIGDRSAEADATTAEGLHDVAGWKSVGLNTDAAQSLSFTDGVPSSLSGLNFDDPAALRTAISQADTAAAKSAARALHIGRPVAIGVDNLIADPSSEAVKHKLSPEPAGG